MPKDEAAGGIASVAQTALHALRAGVSRSLPALRVVNQEEGFDCPGCAWPEPRDADSRLEPRLCRHPPEAPAR